MVTCTTANSMITARTVVASVSNAWSHLSSWITHGHAWNACWLNGVHGAVWVVRWRSHARGSEVSWSHASRHGLLISMFSLSPVTVT